MILLEPHTAIFTGQTGCGKTEKALRLLEKEYENHFDFIIISPTLKHNKTYIQRSWVWNDPYIILIDPDSFDIFKSIGYFSINLEDYKTLFFLDDIIADESLDKRRNQLLKLAISGRHMEHSLWILTQSYTAIPKSIRRQLKMLYVWYQKDRKDLNFIYNENHFIISEDELNNIKNKLYKCKHSCLMIKLEHPKSYDIE